VWLKGRINHIRSAEKACTICFHSTLETAESSVQRRSEMLRAEDCRHSGTWRIIRNCQMAKRGRTLDPFNKAFKARGKQPPQVQLKGSTEFFEVK
jgi:hypothetical protein